MARNRIGLSCSATKAEIQLQMLWGLQMKGKDKISSDYRSYLLELITKRFGLEGSKRKSDVKKKKELEKILTQESLKITQLTGLDEHSADAIVLALGAKV